MSISADQKVTASHLQRNAYLYVRQSTLRQVFENTESTKRQYALRNRATILEFDVSQRPLDAVESILSHDPKIVGVGVYIWNAAQSLQLVADAEGGNRTPTPFQAPDFESGASTSSATSAAIRIVPRSAGGDEPHAGSPGELVSASNKAREEDEVAG